MERIILYTLLAVVVLIIVSVVNNNIKQRRQRRKIEYLHRVHNTRFVGDDSDFEDTSNLLKFYEMVDEEQKHRQRKKAK